MPFYGGKFKNENTDPVRFHLFFVIHLLIQSVEIERSTTTIISLANRIFQLLRRFNFNFSNNNQNVSLSEI